MDPVWYDIIKFEFKTVDDKDARRWSYAVALSWLFNVSTLGKDITHKD